jgi:hypothetical protein
MEKRSQNNFPQNFDHPKPCIPMKNVCWIEEKKKHSSNKNQGVVVGLEVAKFENTIF